MIDDMLEPDDEFGQYEDPEMMGDTEDEEVMEEMEMLGYDVDDITEAELMGGPFARLFRKIRDRVRKRRAARAERKASASLPAEQPYTISTPRGSLTTSPTGLAFNRAAPATQAMQMPSNPMQMIQSNPMLLAIPAGLILFMMMGKRGGGGRGDSRRRR